jgi:hypothetical protein
MPSSQRSTMDNIINRAKHGGSIRSIIGELIIVGIVVILYMSSNRQIQLIRACD